MLGFGAIIGLVIGIVAFVAGLSLPFDSFTFRMIELIQSPLIPVITWMQGAPHIWGSNTDLYKVLAAILCYWTLLGFLVGLGCRLVFRLKGSRVDGQIARRR